MLVELRVAEQRLRAVWDVLDVSTASSWSPVVAK
jgi:hypothetical protein